MTSSLSSIDTRLNELGIELPGQSAAAGNYVPVIEHNGLLYISGQISRNADGSPLVGRMGEGLSIEEGQVAAESCAIQIIAAIKAQIGDLDRVEKIIKLNGFVNSTPDFDKQPAIINGASDFMAEVFGEAVGSHARAAVGMVSLPFNVAVEIDAVVAVR